jgi:hypothetical protein
VEAGGRQYVEADSLHHGSIRYCNVPCTTVKRIDRWF